MGTHFLFVVKNWNIPHMGKERHAHVLGRQGVRYPAVHTHEVIHTPALNPITQAQTSYIRSNTKMRAFSHYTEVPTCSYTNPN